MRLQVTLPWPSRTLHPNSRKHHMALHRARIKAREDARTLARAAGFRPGMFPSAGRLHLWLDFYPPDRRHRDDDGLLSSLKAARDGIADALGIDDNRFVSHPLVREEVRKGGEVVVTITGGCGEGEFIAKSGYERG